MTPKRRKHLASLNQGYQKRNIAKGMCVIHAKRRAAVGGTRCSECIMNGRLYGLRYRSGLSEIEIEKARKAWTEFSNICACCGTTKCFKWCVDHDHVRNIFRGIICYSCNVALGHAQDSVVNLQKLISYLTGESK
jgi:hypothetical protein